MDDQQAIDLVKAIREHSGLELSSIRQAGEHGADAGWAGFTYTSDGADFYRANASLIWTIAADMADQLGAESVPAMVGQFTRADMADTPEGFECLLAWFALEEAGRWLQDRADNRPTPIRATIERARLAQMDAATFQAATAGYEADDES